MASLQKLGEVSAIVTYPLLPKLVSAGVEAIEIDLEE